MDRMTDDALVTALKKKDGSLTKSFMDQYWDSSVRFATALTGDCNAAEDIAQEALIRAMERIDTFQEGRAFRPWFLKIVENLSRDFMRSETRRKARQAKTTQSQEESAPNTSAEEKETASLVREHLSKLDDDYRTALSLRFIESLSLRDISECMDCPESTVSTRIRRGLERLSRSLAPLLSISPAALGPLLSSLRVPSADNPSDSESVKEGAAPRTRKIFGVLKATVIGVILSTATVLVLQSVLLSGLPDPSELPPDPKLSRFTKLRDIDLEREFYTAKELGPDSSSELSPSQSKVTDNLLEGEKSKENVTKKLAEPNERSVIAQRTIKTVLFRVIDENGRPVSGISIDLDRIPEPKLGTSDKTGEYLGRATTDSYGRVRHRLSDGQQSFGPEDRVLLYSYEELWTKNRKTAPAHRAQGGKLDLGDFVVGNKEFCSLTARVFYEGRPVNDAFVRFVRCDKPYDPEKPGTLREWLKEGETNKHGLFTWTQCGELPPRRQFRVQAVNRGYTCFNEVVDFGWEHKEVLIELKKAVTMVGHVMNASGQPISNAEVSCKEAFSSDRTDKNGRFELRYMEEGRSYEFSAIGEYGSDYTIQFKKAKVTSAPLEFVLRKGATLELTLDVPAGIKTNWHIQFLLEGKTADGHKYSIERRLNKKSANERVIKQIPPGTYVLKSPSFPGVKDGISESFTVKPDTNRLPVTVKYEAARRIRVKILDKQGDLKRRYGLKLNGQERKVESDEDGQFVIYRKDNKALKIEVWPRFGYQKLLKTIEVEAGASDVDLGVIYVGRFSFDD